MNDHNEAEAFLREMLGDEGYKARLEESRASRAQEIADARIFHDVFGQGRGPEMLELLRHKTVNLSVMERGEAVMDGDISLNPGEFMAMREGQNALIRWIERKIKLSQEREEE